MSSLVLFESNGVVAEWNKTAPKFTVRTPDGTRRGYYGTQEAAVAAAKRLANKLDQEVRDQ